MRTRQRQRPRHQTVVAYLALAVVLITGTAYAAATIDSGDVINSSLRSVDLKNNSGVKGADVKNGSVGRRDFRASSLTGADVGTDAATGAKVNEASLAASRIVARLGGPVNLALTGATALATLPNPTYTQAANVPNEYLGGAQVTFSAACVQPRTAIVYLLADDPIISFTSIMGIAQIPDSGAGAVTKRGIFVPFLGAQRGLTRVAEAAPTSRTVFVQAVAGCNSGSGVTLDSAEVDVVAHP